MWFYLRDYAVIFVDHDIFDHAFSKHCRATTCAPCFPHGFLVTLKAPEIFIGTEASSFVSIHLSTSSPPLRGFPDCFPTLFSVCTVFGPYPVFNFAVFRGTSCFLNDALLLPLVSLYFMHAESPRFHGRGERCSAGGCPGLYGGIRGTPCRVSHARFRLQITGCGFSAYLDFFNSSIVSAVGPVLDHLRVQYIYGDGNEKASGRHLRGDRCAVFSNTAMQLT